MKFIAKSSLALLKHTQPKRSKQKKKLKLKTKLTLIQSCYGKKRRI